MRAAGSSRRRRWRSRWRPTRPASRPARLGGVPRGRGEPGVARRAEPRSGRAAHAGAAAFGGAGARGAGDGAGDVPAAVVRPDLRPARPGRCRRGGPSCARRWRWRRTICRSTSSRSSRAPPSPPGTRAARSCCRTATPPPRCMRRPARRRRGSGCCAYEVSNYARPGAESRHNLAYWRYADYAGIGPGAHGRVTLGRRSARDAPPSRAGGVGRAGGARRARDGGADRARAPRSGRARCC